MSILIPPKPHSAQRAGSGGAGTSLFYEDMSSNPWSLKPNASTSAMMEPSPEGVEALERLYSFHDYAETLSFLQSYPFLIPLLWEAYLQVARFFGQDTPLRLEVVTDPEDDRRQLVIWIQTRLLPGEALNLLNDLDWDWWLSASDYAQGRLSIDLDFG